MYNGQHILKDIKETNLLIFEQNIFMKDNTSNINQVITDLESGVMNSFSPLNNFKSQAIEAARDISNFIHEKVEKLSTGLYMVTSYMPSDEPVRASLRMLALSTVGHTAHLSMRHPEKKMEDRYLELQKDIRHITSLLHLTQTLEIMSKMNSEILIHEYELLQKTLAFQKDKNQKQKIDVHVHDQDAHYKNDLFQSLHQGARISVEDMQSRGVVSKTFTKLTEPRVEISKASYSNKTTSLQNKAISSDNRERRGKRQAHILGLLSSDTTMTISDLTSRIKGVSGKTIQRELQELVDSKKIKKIGDKRWSKYIKISQ